MAGAILPQTFGPSQVLPYRASRTSRRSVAQLPKAMSASASTGGIDTAANCRLWSPGSPPVSGNAVGKFATEVSPVGVVSGAGPSLNSVPPSGDGCGFGPPGTLEI